MWFAHPGKRPPWRDIAKGLCALPSWGLFTAARSRYLLLPAALSTSRDPLRVGREAARWVTLGRASNRADALLGRYLVPRSVCVELDRCTGEANERDSSRCSE